MPNIKSAKKKMKQDAVRTERNAAYSGKIEGILRKAKSGVKTKKKEFVNEAYASIDKAAKKNIIHKNTAGRLKKRVSRLVSQAS